MENFGVPLTLNVNLSPGRCLRPSSVRGWWSWRRHGLQPGEITLEITEAKLVWDAQADPLQLSEHGFRLSIDDFGQGYSSLSRLYEMPPGAED